MMAQRLTRIQSREQTRRRLLEAAARLFGEKGFRATSVDDIAEAAGFSKGALYYNFETKDQLFEALVEEHIDVMVGGLEEALADVRTIEDKLAAVQHALASEERYKSGQRLWFEVLAQAMRDEKLRHTVGRVYERMRTAIGELIAEQYRQAGARPPLPPRELATAIIAGSLGHGLMRSLDPEAVPSGLMPSVVALLLRP
jgi:AcrR family transcriptional regulator